MGFDYPHRLCITRAVYEDDGAGGLRPTGALEVIYDGPADVQESKKSFRVQDGSVVDRGDATAFVPETRRAKVAIAAVKADDEAVATLDFGCEEFARVVDRSTLDYKVFLRYKT